MTSVTEMTPCYEEKGEEGKKKKEYQGMVVVTYIIPEQDTTETGKQGATEDKLVVHDLLK